MRARGVVLVAAAAATMAACGGGASSSGVHAVSTTTTTQPAPTTTSTTAPPDPGLLPQTRDQPVAAGPMFDAGVQGLWRAVVTDDPAPAMPFFFPLTAYLQVKAISDPAGDWQHRLVAAYDRDIHSIHATLGPNAAQAQFLGIDVPAAQAQWINPGVEYNKIGYWRIYGSRVRYAVNGRAQSFAVTSLISWRGQWYVVHLGPISG